MKIAAYEEKVIIIAGYSTRGIRVSEHMAREAIMEYLKDKHTDATTDIQEEKIAEDTTQFRCIVKMSQGTIEI